MIIFDQLGLFFSIMLNHLINFFSNISLSLVSIGPYLVGFGLIALAVVAIVFNIQRLKATYNCLTLKNVLTFRFPFCFSSTDTKTTQCRNDDIGYTHGWCVEKEKLLPGDATGPYDNTCKDWIWDKCPPASCEDIGAGSGQVYGWCVDTNSPMRGKPCGPTENACQTWLWDVKKCSCARDDVKCLFKQPEKPLKVYPESTKKETILEDIEKKVEGETPTEEDTTAKMCGRVGDKIIPCPDEKCQCE